MADVAGISTSPSKPGGGIVPGHGPWPRVIVAGSAIVSAAALAAILLARRARMHPPIEKSVTIN